MEGNTATFLSMILLPHGLNWISTCFLLMLDVHIQFQVIYFCGNRNLVDAANIAALAALLTFQRPECSLGGEDGQEVIVHPPEVRFPGF